MGTSKKERTFTMMRLLALFVLLVIVTSQNRLLTRRNLQETVVQILSSNLGCDTEACPDGQDTIEKGPWAGWCKACNCEEICNGEWEGNLQDCGLCDCEAETTECPTL